MLSDEVSMLIGVLVGLNSIDFRCEDTDQLFCK